MHQSDYWRYTIQVILHTNPPQNIDDANQVMDNVLATAMHATRCAVSSPFSTTPGTLVYGRDMIMCPFGSKPNSNLGWSTTDDQ